jgi:hypothetical protein
MFWFVLLGSILGIEGTMQMRRFSWILCLIKPTHPLLPRKGSSLSFKRMTQGSMCVMWVQRGFIGTGMNGITDLAMSKVNKRRLAEQFFFVPC